LLKIERIAAALVVEIARSVVVEGVPKKFSGLDTRESAEFKAVEDPHAVRPLERA
jgi:hypothetical protein